MSLFSFRKFWPKHDNNTSSNNGHSSSCSASDYTVVEEPVVPSLELIQPAATAVDTNTPPEEPQRNNTPFSCYRMSKRNEPSSTRATSLTLTIPIKRRKTVEEKWERERSKSCIASWTGHTEGLNIVVAPPYQLNASPVPKDSSVEKLVAFLNMCDKHQGSSTPRLFLLVRDVSYNIPFRVFATLDHR